MADDETPEEPPEDPLDRLIGRTAEQLAGIDRLGKLSESELLAFMAAVDEAWNANFQAMQDAGAAVVEARREQAQVETEAGNAAVARDPNYPLLNAEERARVTDAKAAVDAARKALSEAQQHFKAGVTADDLAEFA